MTPGAAKQLWNELCSARPLREMEGFAPAVADLAPPPRPHNVPTIPHSSYNISLNLTSILALIPGSGFLWRLRRGAFEIPLDASEMPTASAVEEWASQASQVVAAESAKEELPSFPGPWGFFTSGYIVGLFIMVGLMSRYRSATLTEVLCRLCFSIVCRTLSSLLDCLLDAQDTLLALDQPLQDLFGIQCCFSDYMRPFSLSTLLVRRLASCYTYHLRTSCRRCSSCGLSLFCRLVTISQSVSRQVGWTD